MTLYSNYTRLIWLLLALFLTLGVTTVSAHRKRLSGRFMVEFDRRTDNADAHRDSDALLNHLKARFPDVRLTVPSVLNYDVMRAATLQIDTTKGYLHDSIIQEAKDSGLVTDIHPLHLLTRPRAAVIPPIPSTNPEQGHRKLKRALKTVANQKLLMAHSMTQVDAVHNEGNTGQGIHIAILDDGVDYNHPALGGGFGPNFKISQGWDFVGVPELEDNGYGEYSGHQPDNDPLDDCGDYGYYGGHGTHVSGIIGAVSDEPYYRGVAPDAVLGMYRVMDCTGKGDDGTIAAGLARASESGADIISTSIAGLQGWSESILSVVAERIITEKGIPIIVSAGNDGAEGVFTVSQPSIGVGVTAVASVDNNYKLQDTIIVSGIEDTFDIFLANASKTSNIPDGELVFGGMKVGSDSDACASDDVPPGVKGRLAIIQGSSTCTFDSQVYNLYSKGAIGVLIYNIKDNGDLPLYVGVPLASIPVAGLSYSSGTAISRALVEQGKQFGNANQILSVEASGRVVPTPTGGRISDFSAIGPTYENHFKPNIAGVGGFVFSTYPRYMGSWQTINGTSMSAPYFSGSFALYLKAMRDDTQQQKQTPAYMLEQFQNHASKVPSWNFKDVYLSPFVQSAGLVQVHDAIHQKTHVTPATISFNDTANLVNTRTVTITNNGDFTVEYDIVNHRSESILPYVRDSYVFTKQIQYINNMTAHIEFPYEAIRLLPGQYIDVNLTITPPDADPSLHLMYGGFILFKDRSANKKDLTVPYIGIVGDQRELPVFAPNLPAVAGSDGNFISKAQTIVYDQKDENTAPFIVFSFATPTKRVNFELYDSVNNKLVGYVLPSTDFLPRPTYTEDDPSADQSSFQWTGTYFNSSIRDPKATPSQVSQGSYYIVISALKLLGDPNNSQDWESWRSNIIQVI